MFDIVHLHFGWPQFRLYFGQMWFECITATLLVLFYTHSLAIDFHVTDTEVKSNRLKGTMKRLINPRRAKYVRLGWAQYSPSRELLTTAGTNIVASFLRCLPVGPSATRSSRMFNVGGRSQVRYIKFCVIFSNFLTFRSQALSALLSSLVFGLD